MNRTYQAFENIRYTESELKKEDISRYIGLYGSDNYGLNTAESDYDFKAIVAPTIRDFIKGKQVSTTIELPFGLCDVKNPQNMFNCWKKQNINFLEILFTNYYLFNDNLFYDLREMREEIARWRLLNNVMCIYGMACQNIMLYSMNIHLIKKKLKSMVMIVNNFITYFGYNILFVTILNF